MVPTAAAGGIALHEEKLQEASQHWQGPALL
jgi:hypothetical protein